MAIEYEAGQDTVSMPFGRLQTVDNDWFLYVDLGNPHRLSVEHGP
jgi:hypothetical protein